MDEVKALIDKIDGKVKEFNGEMETYSNNIGERKDEIERLTNEFNDKVNNLKNEISDFENKIEERKGEVSKLESKKAEAIELRNSLEEVAPLMEEETHEEEVPTPVEEPKPYNNDSWYANGPEVPEEDTYEEEVPNTPDLPVMDAPVVETHEEAPVAYPFGDMMMGETKEEEAPFEFKSNMDAFNAPIEEEPENVINPYPTNYGGPVLDEKGFSVEPEAQAPVDPFNSLDNMYNRDQEMHL